MGRHNGSQASGTSALAMLEWIARVGPVNTEILGVAFARSERRAQQCVAQLIADGWVRRNRVTWGDGALVMATRSGVERIRLSLRTRSRPPAPTWCEHHLATGWAAAWLTVRGRAIQGAAEIDVDDSWRGEIIWHDKHGDHRVGHRPDLAWLPDGGGRVAVEVELARKSTPRLRAVLDLHARWRASGLTGGVIYICDSGRGRERVTRIGAEHGLVIGGGLRLELLDDIQRQARDTAAHRETKPQLSIEIGG